jgi:hypothetical protein
MIKYNVLFFLAALFQSFSFATECSNIEIDKKIIGPIVNQSTSLGGIGWCTSYATSILLSNEFGFKVSAMDLAMNRNLEEDQQRRSEKKLDNLYSWKSDLKFEELIANKLQLSGNPLYQNVTAADIHTILQDIPSQIHQIESAHYEEVLKQAEQIGVCKESDFNSKFDLEGIEPIFDLLVKSKQMDNFSPCVQNEIVNRSKIRFPALEMNEIVKILAMSNSENVLKNLKDKACKKRMMGKFFTLKKSCAFYGQNGSIFVDRDYRKIMTEEIKGHLLNKKPVGLSIYLKSNEVTKNAHAIVVIGMRKNKQNKCEFLLRDSGRLCFSKNNCVNATDYWSPVEDVETFIFETIVINKV